jgi:hypothetical protein
MEFRISQNKHDTGSWAQPAEGIACWVKFSARLCSYRYIYVLAHSSDASNDSWTLAAE